MNNYILLTTHAVEHLVEKHGLGYHVTVRANVHSPATVSFFVERIHFYDIPKKIKLYRMFREVEKSVPAGVMMLKHNTKTVNRR